MLINKVGITLAVILVLSACSTMTVQMDYDDSLAFTGLQSYNWVPGGPAKAGDPKLDTNTLLHDRIRIEIENWMHSSGYNKEIVEKADFLVTYYVVVEKKSNITIINDAYGYPRNWRYSYAYPVQNRQYVYEYDQGTLIIDIVDSKTHNLMWRGTAKDEVEETNTPEQKRAQIAEAVRKTLNQFPPVK